MYQVLVIVFTLLSALPEPIFLALCLVIFIGILVMLLKLVKYILDAIPFV